MMEKERHYFIVGLFVFLTLTAASIFVVWMLSQSGKGEQKPYVIYFNQAISGVSVGSQVRLQGISVGTIKKVGFDRDNPKVIRMIVELDPSAPIDGTTRATVQMQGVTGQSVVALNSKDDLPSYAATQALSRDREGLPIIPSEPSKLEQVFDKLPGMIDDMRDLARRGQSLLSDENVQTFHDALAGISSATQSLSKLSTKGQSFFSEDNNAELRDMLTEGKLTLREVRFLAKSLRDDPSQIIYRSNYGGYQPEDADAH